MVIRLDIEIWELVKMDLKGSGERGRSVGEEV
jgi:hypothetical protein